MKTVTNDKKINVNCFGSTISDKKVNTEVINQRDKKITIKRIQSEEVNVENKYKAVQDVITIPCDEYFELNSFNELNSIVTSKYPRLFEDEDLAVYLTRYRRQLCGEIELQLAIFNKSEKLKLNNISVNICSYSINDGYGNNVCKSASVSLDDEYSSRLCRTVTLKFNTLVKETYTRRIYTDIVEFKTRFEIILGNDVFHTSYLEINATSEYIDKLASERQSDDISYMENVPRDIPYNESGYDFDSVLYDPDLDSISQGYAKFLIILTALLVIATVAICIYNIVDHAHC